MSSVTVLTSSVASLTSLSRTPHETRGGSRGNPDRFQGHFHNALRSLGVDDDSIRDIGSQIQRALDEPAGDLQSRRDTLKEVIDNVLRNNGVDPADFRKAMRSNRPDDPQTPPVLKDPGTPPPRDRTGVDVLA